MLFLLVDDYTVKNAFLWGLCRKHIYKAIKQHQWNNRLVHLIIGLTETIPIIGQIVSLLELGKIRFFPFPQPVSRRPKITLTRYQEDPSDAPRYWPQNLRLFGLTEEERRMVDTCIRDGIRACHQGGFFRINKKLWQYGKNEGDNSTQMPISAYAFTAQQIVHVVLLSKKIFATGGERTIRWAYDVTTGEFLVKKRVIGCHEESLVRLINRQRQEEGIAETITWRSVDAVVSKLKPKKMQMIEPIRDGSLAILFGTEPFTHFKVRQDLIIDLLEDLRRLHQITENVKLNDEEALCALRAFHGDIKINNILVFSDENGKWRGEISDFGHNTDICASTISTGFTSPEYIRFFEAISILSQAPYKDIADFNMRNGQKRDVWAMGLVILSILVGRKEKLSSADIAPLPCLRKFIHSDGSLVSRESDMLNLTQEVLDHDINELQEEVLCDHELEDRPAIERLFGVIKHMLKVNPDERYHIERIISEIREDAVA